MARSDRRAKGRVLVVDDSAVVRAVVRAGLTSFDVHEADSGQDALEKLRTHAFDAVVTDLNMPGIDGFGVLAAARAMAGGPEVVILTGARAGDIQSALRALRLGAHDYLTKPPKRPGEIALAVEKAIEKKRLRDENARLLTEMAAMSRTDALTSLLNRRAFDDALATETARTRRSGSPLSLVMFDVDHFKAVNDTHGHPAGDAVLARFAQVVTRALRTTDSVFRFGGEEFVALLPDTPLGGAFQAVERALEECRREEVVFEKSRIHFTVSAGIAAASAGDADPADLLARADRALYRAKGSGRDRAAVAGTGAAAENRIAS